MDLKKNDHTSYTNGFHHDDISPSLPRRLTDLMFGFCASQALFTACEVGIFDALNEADRPLSAAVLSQKLSINHDATCRLLDALCGMELLERNEDKTYRNTSLAEKYLTSNSPESIQSSMAFGNTVLYRLFGNLNWAVREGTNQWQRSFNKTCARDFFKDVFSDTKSCVRFMEGMRGTCRPAAVGVVTAFDLSSYRHMCDLGGKYYIILHHLCLHIHLVISFFTNLKICICNIKSLGLFYVIINPQRSVTRKRRFGIQKKPVSP